MGVRHIDTELCTGCNLCVLQCPMDVFRLDTYLINKEEMPPCQEACPAGVNMRGYIYLLRQREYDEAIKVVREALALPAVTGRVCSHPCEAKCARQDVDEAVNINSLERFIADYWLDEKATPVPKVYETKVAVIGSGPAGLGCAYDLARKGYPVTIFEAAPKCGGLLRYGIPEYRLPKVVLDKEISYIEGLGVEIKTSSPVKKPEDLLSQGYEATFIATGAAKSQKMGIPNEDANGVIHALDFLKQVNSGDRVTLGDQVAVIGGGNAAVDAARVARRQGARTVSIVYRRSLPEMPAISAEVEEAQREGVEINTLVAPVEVLTVNNQVTGIRCIRMQLGKVDASGRPEPTPVKGSEFDMALDNVIVAIGQAVDTATLPSRLKLTSNGTISVDLTTLQTNLKGLFAGGDAISGPGSVIEAMASGRRAAAAIVRYLKGEDLKVGKDTGIKRVKEPPRDGVVKKERQDTSLLPPENRQGNFGEVKLGFTTEIAFGEAQRCMACGSKATIKYLRDCQSCALCEGECPTKAIFCLPTFERRVVTAWR